MTAPSSSKRNGALLRVVGASLVGTTVEWYDFFLYGTASALVFNKVFFPSADPLTGALLSFTTYALGFLARPLGGIIFGHYGDRIGRKKLLMISLMVMGGATVAVGLLPTYHQVGLLAPLLLVIVRLIQGFAIGGEWGGAVLIVAEHGGAKGRGFWSSWPQAGVPAGNLLGTAVLAVMSAVLSEADFLAWGWRVAFLLSAVLIAVGYWVRHSVDESPAFEEARKVLGTSPAPVLEVIRTRPKGLAIGAGLRFAENLSFYIITTFSILYLVSKVGLTRQLALNALMAGSAVELITLPFFAWLSDRIGRRPVYAVGAFGMGVWAFAFFRLLDTANPTMVFAAIIVAMVLHGVMYGPQAAFLAELFPTRLRYSGVSLSYQVTSVFAGSLAPIIATALLKTTGSALPIAIYVAIACAISTVTALLAKETKGKTQAQLDAP
jgi:metabolite-proton symporter